jgi:hypothetical protein
VRRNQWRKRQSCVFSTNVPTKRRSQMASLPPASNSEHCRPRQRRPVLRGSRRAIVAAAFCRLHVQARLGPTTARGASCSRQTSPATGTTPRASPRPLQLSGGHLPPDGERRRQGRGPVLERERKNTREGEGRTGSYLLVCIYRSTNLSTNIEISNKK